MSNVLKSEKQEQVRALGQLGWSLRRIEEATGVRRETVSRHLKAAGIPIRGKRKRRLAAHDEDEGADPKAASQVTTDLERGPGPSWSPRVSACEKHRKFIELQVRLGRTAMAIWQDLVDDKDFTSSYACVRRFVRKLRGPSDLPPVWWTRVCCESR